MARHGSDGRSGQALANELSSIGGEWQSHTGRETTNFALKVQKGDINKATEILGDLVSNSSVNPAALEAEREVVRAIHENSNNEYQHTTLEAAHYNAFRDHMMGQPTRGDIDNLNNISAQDITEFHEQNYVGDNIVVVGSGNVDHDQLVDQVESHFSKIPKTASSGRNNDERAIYTPSLLFMRDDEMVNSNVGVFFDAPSLTHKDYWGFQMLKHIIGDYNIQKNAEHLNDVVKQYNGMQMMLGDLPDVTLQRCHHLAYSDCAIWGNYFFGNEVFTRQMAYCGMGATTVYSEYMNDVEVFRARNKMYNNLLNKTGVFDTMHEIAPQVLYQGRRIPRSEVAKRIAHFDAYHMRNLCYEWLYDAEPSVVGWGPVENLSAYGSYKYYKQHTLGTVTNAHHALQY